MDTSMQQYREKKIRGTYDFPLSRYRFIRKNRQVALHWHPEIEIIYVAEGEMSVQVTGEDYVLNSGDIFFINPEELHAMTMFEEIVDYHVIVFESSMFQYQRNLFLEQEMIMPLVNGSICLPRRLKKGQKGYERIAPIIRRIFFDDAESKAMTYADLTVLFCSLLEESLLVKVFETNGDRHMEAIKRCISYMKEQYGEKITLAELAKLVHMSPSYFSAYFKKYTGTSPFAQLLFIRVKAAEKMLVKTDEPIVNVAGACGFENVSFFIRKFKEITGETPAVYRRKMR